MSTPLICTNLFVMKLTAILPQLMHAEGLLQSTDHDILKCL